MPEDKVNERNTDKYLGELEEDIEEFQPSLKEDGPFYKTLNKMTMPCFTPVLIPDIKSIKTIEDSVPIVEDKGPENDVKVETEEKLAPDEDQPEAATCTTIDGEGDKRVKQINSESLELIVPEVNAKETDVRDITDVQDAPDRSKQDDKNEVSTGVPTVYADVRRALEAAKESGKFLITVSCVDTEKESTFNHFFAVHNFPSDDIKGVMDHLKKDIVAKLKLDSVTDKDILGIGAWK